jgi:His-Xaa-Ser system protein HxsD
MKTKKGAKAQGRWSAKEMILDAGIYSGEAVKLAAFVFSERADIRIAPGKGVISVSIKAGDADRAAGEFLNEVLNQQCRIDLAKKNSKIAGIIITKALLSAAGKK